MLKPRRACGVSMCVCLTAYVYYCRAPIDWSIPSSALLPSSSAMSVPPPIHSIPINTRGTYSHTHIQRQVNMKSKIDKRKQYNLFFFPLLNSIQYALFSHTHCSSSEGTHSASSSLSIQIVQNAAHVLPFTDIYKLQISPLEVVF